MSDLSPLEAFVERQAQQQQEFQRGVMRRLLPPEKDTRTPAQVMADGYRDSAAEREAALEDGDAA
jgi:hypothetical protein